MSAQSSPPSFNVDNTDADTPPPFVFNTKVMVGAVVLLLGVICFILMLHIYARWFLRRSSRLYFIGQGRVAPSARHNTGLDKATISQLPSFVYTAAAASPLDNSDEAGKLHKCSAAMPGPECSVCLSEFQENEKVRMLPACKHIFHIDCVDMWLLSHTTCPLCRTDVVPSTVQTDQPHQEQEAMAPSAQIITEANFVMVPLVVEYPCNVLFWGDQTQVISSLETPVSNVAMATTLPQITIEIPPRDHANVLVGASGSLSAKGLTDEEAGSSQALRSPSQLGASIKKMLSRQSSRHKSQRQEGNEESNPK